MKLVLLALRRPVTIVVAVIAVALCSWLAMNRMHVDIFPSRGAPAVYVAQPYSGMDPQQMEGFLSYYFEYHFLYITGIDHVESKNIQGAALMKLVFHPGTDMSEASATSTQLVLTTISMRFSTISRDARKRAGNPSSRWRQSES